MNKAEILLQRPAKGARHVVLLDPEKLGEAKAAEYAGACTSAGVDALFVGGSSTGSRRDFERVLKAIKSTSGIPVILFPGSAEQIVPHADAVLFMSLLSGRNPRFLIDEQVRGAPLIREYGLLPIPMGYLLIESDRPSAVQRVSDTKPISRSDVEGAVNHALAAQYLGMKLVYLEGGSGVGLPVPEAIVAAVRSAVRLPIIVGGGIKTPEQAMARVKSGADIIVTGNILEQEGINPILHEFVQAIHSS